MEHPYIHKRVCKLDHNTLTILEYFETFEYNREWCSRFILVLCVEIYCHNKTHVCFYGIMPNRWIVSCVSSTWRNRTDCMLSVNISVSGHQMDVKSSVAREMKLMAVNVLHIQPFVLCVYDCCFNG